MNDILFWWWNERITWWGNAFLCHLSTRYIVMPSYPNWWKRGSIVNGVPSAWPKCLIFLWRILSNTNSGDVSVFHVTASSTLSVGCTCLSFAGNKTCVIPELWEGWECWRRLEYNRFYFTALSLRNLAWSMVCPVNFASFSVSSFFIDTTILLCCAISARSFFFVPSQFLYGELVVISIKDWYDSGSWLYIDCSTTVTSRWIKPDFRCKYQYCSIILLKWISSDQSYLVPLLQHFISACSWMPTISLSNAFNLEI